MDTVVGLRGLDDVRLEFLGLDVVVKLWNALDGDVLLDKHKHRECSSIL